jgi:hypothetical protein
VTDAHSGTYAEKLQITSYTSGDRKLVTSQATASCTPAAKPGATNTLSAWYKSDHAVQLMIFYQTADGVWHYWSESPLLPASSAWTQGSWTSPVTPSTAVKISFGLVLPSAGTVTMDDFNLTEN